MRQYQLSKGMHSKPKSKIFFKPNEFKQEKINRLEKNRLTSNYKTVSKYDWHLAGFDKAKADCGKWLTKGCLNVVNHPQNKAWIKHYKKCCHRSSCEKCIWKWCDREANRATHRFDALSDYANRLFGSGFRYNPIHVVVSIPKSDWSLEYRDMKKKTIKVLKRVNLYGGMIIFHPFRQHKDPEKCKCSEILCVQGDWFWSPHFHVVGVGWILGKEVEDEYYESEWTVINLGVRKSVFKTIWYQLSHCGIKKTKKYHYHAVTWFGILGYHGYYAKVLKEYSVDDTDFCPYCYEKLFQLTWQGRKRPPPQQETEHSEPLSYWEYLQPDIESKRKLDELFE